MFIIYVITNLATGKVYIGQHRGNSLKKYLQTKLSDANKRRGGSSRLYASMRKHPKDVWSIEPLMETDTKEKLDRLETVLIALYDTRNPEIGYNICKGGEGFTGPFTVEHRAKLSAAAKITRNYLKAAEVTRGIPRPLNVRAQIASRLAVYTQTVFEQALAEYLRNPIRCKVCNEIVMPLPHRQNKGWVSRLRLRQYCSTACANKTKPTATLLKKKEGLCVSQQI